MFSKYVAGRNGLVGCAARSSRPSAGFAYFRFAPIRVSLRSAVRTD